MDSEAVNVSIYMYVCMYVASEVRGFRGCECKFIYMYVCMCECVCMYVCMYV